MTPNRPSPPRLARAILWALLPRRQRVWVLDDLDEEFRDFIAPAVSRRSASLWYWRQVLSGAWDALRMRWGRRGRRHRRGAFPRRRFPDLHTGWASVTHALRRLVRSPGFTLAAVVTVALGLGANAAIFTLVNAILLRPLPYPDPGRLVVIEHAIPGLQVQNAGQSSGTYFHYRDNAEALAGMAVYHEATVNLTGGGDEPERIRLMMVTPSLFSVLGAPPHLGRLFDRADADPAREPVVILSYGLWRARYGSDPGIVGRTVVVNDVPRVVVGVMGPRFDFPDLTTQMWMPDGSVTRARARFTDLSWRGVARLREGVSPEGAQEELAHLVPAMGDAYPDMTRETLEQIGFTPRVIELRDHVVGDVGTSLWLLLATVGVVLLIAAANVANLFLVRAEYRRREIAVRRALGARRSDLIGYFLAESMWLGVAGGALGMVLAWAGTRLLVASGPATLPRMHEIGVDTRVVSFAALLTLATALALGAIPALRHRRLDVSAALRDGPRGGSAGRAANRASRVMVAVQMALALTLLIGSTLMVRSFMRVRAVDVGFAAEDVLAIDFALPFRKYPDFERSAGFFQELVRRIEGLPGVESAGGVTNLPLAPPQFPPLAEAIQVEGRTFSAVDLPPAARVELVLPGYFTAMRIPALEGRIPETDERAGAENPVLLSAALAELLFPGEDAVGKRLRRVEADPSRAGPWWTVVGVVGDVRYADVVGEPEQILYLPVLDRNIHPGLGGPSIMTVTVRTSSAPLSLTAGIRRIVSDMDPNMPIANVRTVERVVADAMARVTFTTTLLLIAAVAALFLGAVGIYGVISYAVGRRVHEVGVRMALGARAWDVQRMVLRQGAVVALVGVGAGLIASLWSTRFLGAMLFEISPTDPMTFALTSMLLLVVALLATYVPARRAARVDPAEALRGE